MKDGLAPDVPVGSAVLDRNGRLGERTKSFRKLLEQPGIEVGKNPNYASLVRSLVDASTIEPERRADFVAERIDAFASNRADNYVLHFRNSVVLGLEREPLGDHGSVLSIVDLGDIEQREALFAAAERMARSGVWSHDFATNVISFSESVWEIFGPGAKEKMGTLDKWVEFVHPDDREMMVAAVQRTVTRSEPYDLEYRIYRTDGQLIQIAAKGEVVFDRTGKPRMARGVFQDITEVRAAQEALRHSEAWSYAVINNNPDIISILDSDGRFAFISPSVTSLLGYEQSELLTRPALELVHPADLASTAAALGRILATPGHSESAELRFKHKDGSWRTLEVIGRNLLDNRAVGGVLLNTRDITERRSTEAQLRQSQKMEAIGQLTGGIAHDFNNLLAVIVGDLDLLTLGLGDEAQREQLIEQAIGAAERGKALTARLLAFARQQPLEPRQINFNALMIGMEGLLKRTLGPTIDLEIKLAPDLAMCEVDQAQMKNAILNLAINARDAMSAGGRLTIRTENVGLDQEHGAAFDDLPAGDYVSVTVSDTGIGMSPEIAARIFEPFFTTKEHGKGTGLGLSMVYGFVKQSRGHVRVYSEPGAGTTFRIYLPRSAASARGLAAASDAREDTPSGHGETIFVVEDDPNVMAVTTEMLHRLGYKVLSADSAAAALEKLRTAKETRLLLTDVFLSGGMRGPELAGKAGELIPGLEVLYMSGYTEGLTILEEGPGAAAGFLPKPFRKRELAQKLRHALERADRT